LGEAEGSAEADLAEDHDTDQCAFSECLYLWSGKTSLEREMAMDKDRVIGSAKVIKGKVKEAVGKALGDAKLETEGKAEKIEGKVQNAVGGVKDKLRGR
jgi:uncharacterized protein YjbJ (UPF0337 family)